jgi:hypothetical protein
MGGVYLSCRILKRGDGIPFVLYGCIGMEESCAFITKFNPFNYSPLFPVRILLMKDVLMVLFENISKVPLLYR